MKKNEKGTGSDGSSADDLFGARIFTRDDVEQLAIQHLPKLKIHSPSLN